MMIMLANFSICDDEVKNWFVSFPPNPQQSVFASRDNSLPVRTPVHCVHLNIKIAIDSQKHEDASTSSP